LCLAAAVSAASAQEGSLRFEKTVPWTTGKLMDLNATVGPVRVGKVELSNQGKSGGGGASGIAARFRSGGNSGTETILRATFDTENPTEQEWEVTYTVEFLDGKGRLIDRAVGSEGFEGEADTYKLDHAILEYVVPMIDKVRIKLEAKLD
jgi:hypothetical protein